MQAVPDMLIGTYDGGIICRDQLINVENPSYCLLSGRYLISVVESQEGQIVWFDTQDNYKQLGKLATQGVHPCHLAVDRTNRMLFVTNYSSANVAVYSLKQDGQPDTLVEILTHSGSSADPDRQSSPHPHCTAISHDNQTAFISDLGTDYVYWYELDAAKLSLKQNLQRSIKFEAGSGPRHIALGRQEDKTLYVSCELKSSMVGLKIQNNRLVHQFTVNTVPGPSVNYPSEIKYFTIGAYEYVAMAGRGDDNVVIYRLVDKHPEVWLTVSVKEWPRHFNLNKDRTLLAVACQKANKVIEYSIEGQKALEIRRRAIQTPSYVEYL